MSHTKLHELEAEQLVRRAEELEPTYVFRHGLVQATAYDSLLKTQRRRLHQAVARVMEECFPERLDEFSDLLAYHWEQAEVPERARHYLFIAGKNAARRYANTEALELYGHALAHSGSAPAGERMAIYNARAELYEFLSRYDDALADYECALVLARETHAAAAECRILARVAWLHWLAGRATQALAAAHAAQAQANTLHEQSPALRAYLVDGLVAQAKGHLPEAYPRLRKALLASRSTHERALEGEALFFLGVENNFMGRFGRAYACARKAFEVKSELGDDVGKIVALYLEARAQAGRGRYDEALAALETGRAISAESQNPFGLAQYPNTRAWLAAELGDWETAYELDTAGLEVARAAPVRPPEISNLINLVLDCTALGKLEQADRYLLALQNWVGRAEFGFHAWRWQIRLVDARARLLLAWHLYDEAAQVIGGLFDWAAHTESCKYHARARLLRAEVHGALGNTSAAEADLCAAARLADVMNYYPIRLTARRKLCEAYEKAGRAADASVMQAELSSINTALDRCLTHPDLRRSYQRGLGKP